MSTTGHTRKSVSDIVKQYEEKLKVKPPERKTKLVRDVFRSPTVVENFKTFKASYMLKLERAKYTTWHVGDLDVTDGAEICSGLTDNTRSNNNKSEEANDCPKDEDQFDNNSYVCSTEVTLRHPPSNSNDHNNNKVTETYDKAPPDESTDEKDTRQNVDHTISISDINISKHDSVSNASVGYASTTSLEINQCDSDASVDIRHVDVIANPERELERTSQVVSWIKDCQFPGAIDEDCHPESMKTPDQHLEVEELEVEGLAKHTKCIIVKDEEENAPNASMLSHSYENVEVFRQNIQREMLLVDSIEMMEDEYNTENCVQTYGPEIPEIQFVNNADNILRYNKELKSRKWTRSTSSLLSVNVDEVDVSSKGMFGEGNCTFKVRTSYWEVINPRHNKNAPEQFFNEVNHLTSIPIDIAKYINKHKYYKYGDGGGANEFVPQTAAESDIDIAITATKYYSQESLTPSYRQRCDSTQSAGTLGSDDFIMQTSNHSSVEDLQSSPGLIRTNSKLVRVDQTYYNDTLRITKNVILKDSSKSKPKSEYIVDELINTELSYLTKLEFVRDTYIPELCNTNKYPQLINQTKYLFLNWNMIYMRACEFLERIESCHCDYNYEELADNILNSEDLFEEYSYYCKNKAMAERYLKGEARLIIEEVQEILEDKLGLFSYLLEPVQRLTKYKLFLESLKKELSKTGDSCHKLIRAIDMIKTITSESNDCIDASYIKNFPYRLKDQGRIIRKEVFNVVKVKTKTKWPDVKLFLFEKVLIITEPMKSLDGYICKDFIFMDQLSIKVDEKKFVLSDYNANKQANDKNYKSFICRHKDKDVETEWKNSLTKCLEMQFTKIRANVMSNTIPKVKKRWW